MRPEVGTQDPTADVGLSKPEPAAGAGIAPGGWKATALPVWSRAQAIIGVLTGVLSIAGAVYSGVTYFVAPRQGEVAALIREGKTDRPLSGATVEVLTAENALVTTLAPTADGWARHSLREGSYQLRATGPGFGSDTKPIQILAGRTVEVRFHLTRDGGGRSGPVSRFLGKLGL